MTRPRHEILKDIAERRGLMFRALDRISADGDAVNVWLKASKQLARLRGEFEQPVAGEITIGRRSAMARHAQEIVGDALTAFDEIRTAFEKLAEPESDKLTKLGRAERHEAYLQKLNGFSQSVQTFGVLLAELDASVVEIMNTPLPLGTSSVSEQYLKSAVVSLVPKGRFDAAKAADDLAHGPGDED